jgi:hypothetical protein
LRGSESKVRIVGDRRLKPRARCTVEFAQAADELIARRKQPSAVVARCEAQLGRGQKL